MDPQERKGKVNIVTLNGSTVCRISMQTLFGRHTIQKVFEKLVFKFLRALLVPILGTDSVVRKM